MTSFSERSGYVPARTVIQHESLDSGTRVQLWNVIFVVNEVLLEHGNDDVTDAVGTAIWGRLLNRPRDEEPNARALWLAIKRIILEHPWNEALDVVDAFARFLGSHGGSEGKSTQDATMTLFNEVFVRTLVDCRFIDRELVQVGNEIDVAALENALEQTSGFPGARQHLKRASALLSDRSHPDYLNSMKESISAVESVVKKQTGKGSVGDGLKILAEKRGQIHPSLQVAWTKMYGWASNDPGIRHAAIEASGSSQPMAKYLLVASSAFVSYLIEADLNDDDNQALLTGRKP
jgi:hypothetical protein